MEPNLTRATDCSSLPFELLAQIFIYVTHTLPPGDLRWSFVMLVCRKWYNVVMNSPKLWTTISCHHIEARWIDRLLSFSQDLPISIKALRNNNSFARTYTSLSLLHSLSTHLAATTSRDIARVHEINIRDGVRQGHWRLEESLESFIKELPMLHTFYLSARHYEEELNPLLFGGIAPKLRRFTLRTELGARLRFHSSAISTGSI